MSTVGGLSFFQLHKKSSDFTLRQSPPVRMPPKGKLYGRQVNTNVRVCMRSAHASTAVCTPLCAPCSKALVRRTRVQGHAARALNAINANRAYSPSGDATGMFLNVCCNAFAAPLLFQHQAPLCGDQASQGYRIPGHSAARAGVGWEGRRYSLRHTHYRRGWS